MQSATKTLLTDIRTLIDAPLPTHIQTAARLRILDYVGCTLAGARMERDRMLKLALASGAGTGPSRLIGLELNAAPSIAALVNGANAHVAELDDGNRFGMVHPGAPVISAVLAQAQASGLNDDDILRGVVVGYEVVIRLARAAQPQAKDAGLHATGIAGTVGAAVGVAAALGLDDSGLNAALSGGCTAASGLLKVIRGASQFKPFNSGHAAQAGLSAALMAHAGFVGTADVLDGVHGYFHVMAGNPEIGPEAVASRGKLGVEDVYVKPYASCRHCHAPVEAALALRDAHSLEPQDILKIDVATHRMAVHLHDHVDITGVHSAKMSVNYCVAAALSTGHSGMDAFTPENVASPDILDLTRRTNVAADDQLTALVPEKRAAIVKISLKNGHLFEKRIDLPKGEPETPISPAEFEEKFLDLARFGGVKDQPARDLLNSICAQNPSKGLLDSLSAL